MILRGNGLCSRDRMATAYKFEDLVVWQISVALRDLVYRMTLSGPSADDDKFCKQIRDSASSAPRNISEGFGRFDSAEFAQFMKVAKGSLNETLNHLSHGRSENYFSQEDFIEARRLNCRAIRAANRLHAYLRADRDKKRSR
jgi:four helix bundle protein